MKLFLFKCCFIIAFSTCSLFLTAQEDEPGTIRIKKESNLSKAVFDNTELRLMVIDRFGNPRDNKVVSYRLWIKSKSATREIEGYSNNLSSEMINSLKKQTKATKIFFTEITVQDDNGHLVKLPDVIETWFPDCTNCETGRSKRR